jgi:hypothetical protein
MDGFFEMTQATENEYGIWNMECYEFLWGRFTGNRNKRVGNVYLRFSGSTKSLEWVGSGSQPYFSVEMGILIII